MKTIKSKLKNFYLFILVGMICTCSPDKSDDNRPNVIYIMVDDMGYADLSSYGRKDYQTPVLDTFIKEGMKFTQAYSAAPICSPTRVGFMTGRYPARIEVGLYEPLGIADSVGLSTETTSISSILKKSGYETALFGKWHLGFNPKYSPNAHGFDQFFGITLGGADYIDHKYFSDEPILYENDQPVEKDGYLTDLITDYAVDFINKKHDQPFFISLQYTAPHWPWQLPGDDPYPYAESFEGFIEGGSPEIYAGMMKNLDTNIGRVLKTVEAAGLSKSTVIIFTSDNGGEKFSDMGPFQGGKGNLHEGGIRVPAAVKWPGVVPAGSESAQPVITMDWTATILDVAEAEIPSDLLFDGMSLVPLLKGSSPAVPRQLFWRFGRQNLQDAYRDGDWKYLKTKDGEFLFNLINDPGEINNMKESNPEKFNRLKNDFQKLESEMLDRLKAK